MFPHAVCCDAVCLDGSAMASPPSRVCRAIRSRSLSPNVFWPVIDGRNHFLMMSSSGLKRSSTFGIVLAM